MDKTVEHLANWRDTLDQRLTDGWAKIDRAIENQEDPAKIGQWVDFWLTLLREYEAVVDELHKKENANGQ